MSGGLCKITSVSELVYLNTGQVIPLDGGPDPDPDSDLDQRTGGH